ncbi:hypothetical protein D3C87_1713770 [compost metagenome]
MACGGHFFHHRGIFLRVLIHLVHGGIDLLKAGRLLLRGFDDRGDVLVDLLHFGDNRVECLAGVADKMHTLFDLLVRLCDQRLDFLRRAGRTLRKFAHLLRHHGKTLARLAGAGGFHAGIER